MTSTKELNWAVLGVGVIANEMAQALQNMGKKLYAVGNRTHSKAVDFAEKYGIEKVYDDFQDIFTDPEVDIIYLTTPHNTHYPFMKKALENHKHLFVEKSITLNSDELDECVKLAQKNNLILAEAMTIWHMPIYKKLWEMIHNNEFGKVQMITINFGSFKDYDMKNRFFNKNLAGGALLDIGVYATSFARYFMSSKPNTVLTTANYFETGVDETSGIILRNPEGEMAVIALTMRAKQPKRGVVAGEKGYIEVNNYPRGDKATITYTEDGRVEVIEAGNTEFALDYEVQDMENYINNNDGKQNLTYIRDVMATLTEIRSQWGMVYPFE